MQPHPRAGHRSPPLTAERGCPGHKTDSHPHSQCHGEHRWTPGGGGLAQTTGPPWRTIFRFSGDYASLLPKTAFRKAAGQAGRASSGETPPQPPASQAVQTSRAHCSWNNGPCSFQDQGKPAGYRIQQSALPWPTPWQLGLEPGGPDGWPLPKVAEPQAVGHTQLLAMALGGDREGAPPHSSWPTLWPSKPSCPRYAVSRHLAGGPGAPRATTHQITSCLWQGRSCPARGGGPAISPSSPSPKHTLGFQLWDICSRNAHPAPPIRQWDPLRMKCPNSHTRC